MDMQEIAELKRIVEQSESIVFFGGAGVSTASGIPDFRGAGGLYDGTTAEDMLHVSFFRRHPDAFYEFYKANMIYPEARPNAVHYALAELERRGKLSGIITQNIDGLHQLAGSKNVCELHGTVLENFCTRCGAEYGVDYVLSSDGVPRCKKCGGMIKPNVVLYGESLDADVLYRAQELVENADTMLVGGTSLKVYPAAGYVAAFQGENLVIINRDPTPFDGAAALVFHDDLTEVFEALVDD